ncbi:P-loop containing nucleoside triphosphate hydrolase protein [Obelidium mucronatum]|nr:P-loop containing nucleoside triphosphate hydrolase protein [Obelidium mucronatum]
MGPKKKKVDLRGFATASVVRPPKAATPPPPPQANVDVAVAASLDAPVKVKVKGQGEIKEAEADAAARHADAQRLFATLAPRAAADALQLSAAAAASAADTSLAAFSISAAAERRLLAFARAHALPRAPAAEAAEATLAGLLLAYLSLERAGFKQTHIEQAMSACPHAASDLHHLLNWLCINLDSEDLPPKYTDKHSITMEDASVSVVPVQAPSRNVTDTDERSNDVEPSKVPSPTGPSVVPRNNSSSYDGDLKSRILRANSLIQSDSESDSDSKEEEESLSSLPPNELHAQLQHRIDHLKSIIGNFKNEKLAPPSYLLSQVKEYSSRLKSVESLRLFQPRKAEVAYARLMQAAIVNTWDKEFRGVLDKLEELMLKARQEQQDKEAKKNTSVQIVLGAMFDQDESAPQATSNASTTVTPTQILSLEIPKSWTGKTPRTYLQEQCGKQLQKGATMKIKFDKLQDSTNSKFRCNVKIEGLLTGPFHLEPPQHIYTSSQKSGEEYIATLALFKLFGSSLPLYTSLPPCYRDLWISMAETEKAEADALVQFEEDRKMNFLTNLLDNQVKNKKKTEVPSLRPTEIGNRGSHELSVKQSQSIKSQFQQRKETQKYQEMQSFRQQLPVSLMKSQILDLVAKNQVVIISGETGSGKSTQIPQFLLENAIEQGLVGKVNIVCTQPRRISATSIASRVSEELGDPQNFGSGSLVGYSVRLDSKISSTTRLTFQTIGVLLRRAETDPLLAGITHVIVDEPFSWKTRLKQLDIPIDAGSEFAIRRDFKRKNIGTVKVSGKGGNVANMALEMDESDDDMFQDIGALAGYSQTTIDTLKKMDVNQIDLDLVESLGLAEIRKLYDRLTLEGRRENRKSRMLVLPLHSVLTAAEQAAVFKPAPKGVRKVVLSTNIAETGVTIPDVVFVIDTCKAREVSYDQKRNISKLSEILVSQANCKQRRGRAGRVKPGVCYHLVSKAGFESLPAHRPPEMLRLPLEELVLRILASTKIDEDFVDVNQLLAEAPDPPPVKHIERAIIVLKQIQALSADGKLTPLGRKLSSLPVDVRLGKMLLYGCLMKCLDPVLTVAASLSLGKDPFVSRFDDAAATKPAKQYDNAGSDLITIANAYTAWRSFILKESGGSGTGNAWNAARTYCNLNGLNFTNLTMIEEARLQLMRALSGSGIVIEEKLVGQLPRPLLSRVPVSASINEKRPALVVAAIASGIYPSFLIYSKPSSTPATNNKTATESLHLPSSSDQVCISSNSLFNSKNLVEGCWYGSYSMTNSSNLLGSRAPPRIIARDLNRICPYTVLAMAGGVLADHRTRIIKTTHPSIKIKCPPKTATLLSQLIQFGEKALEMQVCGIDVGDDERKIVKEAFELWMNLVDGFQFM